MKQETLNTVESMKDGREGRQWTGGFLVIMGGIFLLGMSDTTIMGHSPWMLMALLPIYWIGVTAYKHYREHGRITNRVFSILVFGLLPFAYIAAEFLDIDAGSIWPVGLIAVGASFLLFRS